MGLYIGLYIYKLFQVCIREHFMSAFIDRFAYYFLSLQTLLIFFYLKPFLLRGFFILFDHRMKSTTSNLLRRAVAWTLMALTIGLLIYQYRFNRSVWLDEAMLSLNIIEKSPLALFKTLGYNQMAPILFLLIEKFFTWLFGDGELALRLFPLISAILTLPLFFD